MNQAYAESGFVHKAMLLLGIAALAPIALWLIVAGVSGFFAVLYHVTQL